MLPTLDIAAGGSAADLSPAEQRALLLRAFGAQLGPGGARRVLLLPPDHTRLHSQAGALAGMLWELFTQAGATVRILPALGTHAPMAAADLRRMFGEVIPADAFLEHDWRGNLRDVGQIEAARLAEWSGGRYAAPVRVQLDNHLFAGHDLIISIGQVVPHEVIGMANFTKNVIVGCGGPGAIHASHFLGAVCGMESIMGRIDTPVRRMIDGAGQQFLGALPIAYVMTVMQQAPDADGRRSGPRGLSMRGLFIGTTARSFEQAARLAQQVNITLLEEPIRHAVVHLAPEEFRSTWLGNKAIYRMRMALATGGRLTILAPGLKGFGEDATIDALIRRHGYRGTPATLARVEGDAELATNLSAAAHLIHGSSEGRFEIVVAPGAGLTRGEIESVGYQSGDLGALLQRYPVGRLAEGWNTTADGERFFYVSNPALGLWALRAQFA